MTPSYAVVLAATDFSASSGGVVPHACGIADAGATVHLVHVVEPEQYPSPLYAHYTPGRTPTAGERGRQEAELRSRLQALVPPDAAGEGIHVEVHVPEDADVARALLRLAEEVGADALVMGSHGRTGLAAALLGSVVGDVIRSTTRPVLVVPIRS